MKNTIILFFPVFDYGRKGCEYLPFSILHLERAVRHLGLNVVLIDENDLPDYDAIIEQHSTDLLLAAVSAITGFQIAGGIEFSKKIKNLHPETPLVWGGWHPTIVPEQTLSESYIDYIITGQGERPFAELTNALMRNLPIDTIAGLGFKSNGQNVVLPPSPFCNINEFPAVDYSLIDVNKYVLRTDFSERRLMYFATYGCPFSCPFCSGSQVFQKKWFPKDIDTIIADIKYFKAVAGIDSILFWDDNFFSNRNFVMRLAERLIEEDAGIVWEGSAHAAGFIKMFSEADISVLYKAGFRRVNTGAESGDDAVLGIIKDKLIHTDVLDMIALLKRHNITTFFSTMIAFPLPKSRDIDATFNFIRQAKLIDSHVKVQINIYTPYPKTPLYAKALDMGFAEPNNLAGWIYHSPATFKPPWVKPEFYDRLNAYMNFYLPFMEQGTYQRAPKTFRAKAYFFNVLMHPLMALRFRYNYFGLAIEWYLFRYLLKRHNRKHNDNLRFYAYGVFGG